MLFPSWGDDEETNHTLLYFSPELSTLTAWIWSLCIMWTMERLQYSQFIVYLTWNRNPIKSTTLFGEHLSVDLKVLM
jgi:hypothetical protein